MTHRTMSKTANTELQHYSDAKTVGLPSINQIITATTSLSTRCGLYYATALAHVH